MKTIITWFVKSSSNPQKISMTVKGLGVAIIPVVVILGGNAADVDGLLAAISTGAVAFFGLIAAVVTGYGFVRKIYNTLSK